jgi:hypothetical protein
MMGSSFCCAIVYSCSQNYCLTVPPCLLQSLWLANKLIHVELGIRKPSFYGERQVVVTFVQDVLFSRWHNNCVSMLGLYNIRGIPQIVYELSTCVIVQYINDYYRVNKLLWQFLELSPC